MTMQLEFPGLQGIATEAPLVDALPIVLAVAQAAVDLERRPGFAAFTTGKVTAERGPDGSITLATDSPWAASAIRRDLLAAGCAVEGDPAHEGTSVTAWPTAQNADAVLPELALAEERDEHGRTTVFLDGPHGTIEQRVGSGGHNDLIVHASHPFPQAVRARCPRHGDGCWMRSQCWPLNASPRRHIRTVVTEGGYAWDVTPEAVRAMRELYLQHVHQTRPGIEPSVFRVVRPVEFVNEALATEPSPAPTPAMPAPRLVNAIRDLADYEPTA